MKAPEEWTTKSRQDVIKKDGTPDTTVKTRDGRTLPHPDGVPTPVPHREDLEMFRAFGIKEREAGE